MAGVFKRRAFKTGSGSFRDTLAEGVLGGAASVSALAIFAIVGFLLYFASPLFLEGRLFELLSWHWRPFFDQFGILSMCMGSLCLALSALILAFPAGVGICLFAHGLGPKKMGRLVLVVIHFMTGIPTVVYGFVSMFLLVPFLRQAFSGSGFCWLAAALTLSILILPTIVLLINSQLNQLVPSLHLTVEAAGISHAEGLLWVILPLASRGLLAAAVLGFGRAVGDTLISLMLAGNAPQVPASALDSIRTLTAHIALVLATDSQSTTYHSLFASGLILLGITAAVNLALRWIMAGPSCGNRGHNE